MLKDQAMAGVPCGRAACTLGVLTNEPLLVFLIPPLSPPSGTQVVHLQVQCAGKSIQAPSDTGFYLVFGCLCVLYCENFFILQNKPLRLDIKPEKQISWPASVILTPF